MEIESAFPDVELSSKQCAQKTTIEPTANQKTLPCFQVNLNTNKQNKYKPYKYTCYYLFNILCI